MPCDFAGMAHSVRPELSAAAHSKLTDWSKAHGTPRQVVKRCRLVLLMASGVPAAGAAKTAGAKRHTAELWRARFREHGPDTLWEIATGRGRKPRAGMANQIVEKTLKSKPRGQTHWSSRQMAGSPLASITRRSPGSGKTTNSSPTGTRPSSFRVTPVCGQAYRRGGGLPQPAGARSGALR
jgi:hypothetical protein